MGTSRLNNPNTSLRKILPFPKRTSYQGCWMCRQLSQGESLWTVVQDQGGRLFQPLDDIRCCPQCGAPVEALR